MIAPFIPESPVKNNNCASGVATSLYGNTQIQTSGDGIPILTLSATNDTRYQSMTEIAGVEYSSYLTYTYEALTYTYISGAFDVGYQYYNGDISGLEASGLGAMLLLVVGGVRLEGINYCIRLMLMI